VRIPRATKRLCAYQAGPSGNWMFLREPPRATLANSSSYSLTQVTTHNHVMQRVPWERELSPDPFIRDAVGKGTVERHRPISASRLSVATLLRRSMI
jgi:hypothetical protein